MASIGLTFNIYNDALALPGLLENAAPFFDDITAVHAGPNGKLSDDGTIEILERWGVRICMSSINEGFGAVRTQCIRESMTDWVMIMDADERFFPLMPALTCEGTEKYPDIDAPNLTVINEGKIYNQGALLRKVIETPGAFAIRTSRRHWFDYSMKRPTQNWQTVEPDWQLRIVKNDPRVRYTSNVKMHERIVFGDTGKEPSHVAFNQELTNALYHDHFHCFWKPQEPAQREHDVRIYDALCNNTNIPSE